MTLLRMEEDVRALPRLLGAIWLAVRHDRENGLDPGDADDVAELAAVTRQVAERVLSGWEKALREQQARAGADGEVGHADAASEE